LRLGIGLVEQRRCFVAQELGERDETARYDDPHYLVENVRRVSGLAGLRSWSEHYNAACIFALPLLVDPIPGTAGDAERRRWLTQLAIRRLERAMACTDSAVIAGRRQWILSEDPDLDALRRDKAFKRFELSYLPSPARSPSRPRCVRRWEIAGYMDRLLAATAKRWETEWHSRGRALDGQPDVHRMLEWWEDERKAWNLVRSVAFNRRHWGARQDLVQRMETWSERYGFTPLEVPLPEYTAAPSRDSPQQIDEMAEAQIAARNERIERIGEILEAALPQRRHARSMLEEMRQLQSELRRCDDQSLPLGVRRVAQLCDAHAGLWQRLREWLEDSPSGEQAFLDAVERDARLWRATQLRWSQQRALRRHLLNPLPLPATGPVLRSARSRAPRRP
jgi:hypothetical protein